MKVMTSFCMVMMVVMVAYAHPVENYPKINKMEVQEILETHRLYNNFRSCLTNEGKCTADGKKLQGAMKESLENNCEKCTEEHKEIGKMVIKYMIEKKPEDWEKLKSIYDPDGKYSAKYEKELKEVQG